MIPFFEIFSSFFMYKSALKIKKNAKIAICGLLFAFVGCSFQQSAPRKLVETSTEATTIEQATCVEFINLSASNGGQKPSISNLMSVAYHKAEKLSLRGFNLEADDFKLIGHLSQTLMYIDLANCGLQKTPSALAEANGVNTLYLSDNQIAVLDESIYSLNNLTYLNLDRNVIIKLPDGISGLKALKWLRLNNNKLSTLPTDMAELKNIKKLYLNKNEFTQVPEVIKQMTSLEELSLGGNKISEFPEWLCEMPNLRRIDLFGNPIKEIPDKIVDMPQLTTLVMDNCLLSNERKLEINKKLADKRIKFIF